MTTNKGSLVDFLNSLISKGNITTNQEFKRLRENR